MVSFLVISRVHRRASEQNAGLIFATLLQKVGRARDGYGHPWTPLNRGFRPSSYDGGSLSGADHKPHLEVFNTPHVAAFNGFLCALVTSWNWIMGLSTGWFFQTLLPTSMIVGKGSSV